MHINVKFNIFDELLALFSLSHAHEATFPYVTTIYQNQDTLYINQFFVFFHLAGVLCLTLEDIMNFWHDLGDELQKMTKK